MCKEKFFVLQIIFFFEFLGESASTAHAGEGALQGEMLGIHGVGARQRLDMHLQVKYILTQIKIKLTI